VGLGLWAGLLQGCSLGGRSEPVVAAGSTLVIELAGGYTESAQPSVFARLAGDGSRPFLSLLSMFTRAEQDARIETVVLRIQPLQIGWGKADEIRAAIGRLRDAGRRTIAHLEIQGFAANRELFIASAADEVHVAPGSALPLVGLAAEYVFLGGFWEQFGVDFDVAKAGRYKSAVETYAERGMSASAREMADSLLDDTYGRFVEALAIGRGLTPVQVRDAIDQGVVRTQQLEELGLIDGEVHLDVLLDRLGRPVVRHAEYARVDPANLGFDAQARIALVFGAGPVVQGRDEASPLSGQTVFASESVSESILAAAEDPEIDAILLRIDSPGGSALASELIWRAIVRARDMGKPVVVSMADVAASGGYYVASAADVIVADPGTLTGSIGVFALRPVLAGLFEKLEIGVEGLTRGRHADFLLSTAPMTEASRARLETSVRDTYQLFLTRVAEGRSLGVEAVDAVAQGRVWTGAQALEVGLVDELGGLWEAARRTKQAIGLPLDADVLLVPYPPPASFSKQLFDALSQAGTQVLRPPMDWPEPLAEMARWAEALPAGTPLLIPPVSIEIR
jgi:protease-4